MASLPVPALYTETQLNLEPAFNGSTIAISLPAHGVSTFGSRHQSKRTIVTDQYVDQDENDFARRHLASEASIFFRRANKYPRCFLWRILDDRKVLEIQSVDLSQEGHTKGEAVLTLSLSFPNSIRPFGVAFADSDERDALQAFVITTASQLYTLNLKIDFFIRPAATEVDVSDWCKMCYPPTFGTHVPYRLVARNAHELLISARNGNLLRLTRQPGDDGSAWSEIYFSQSGWSTLRGMVSWKSHNTIRWNNADVEPTAAVSIALSPDEAHIWTVSLDHTLRARSVKTSKIGVQMDLLGDNNREPQKASQYFIGAAQPQVMQIVKAKEDYSTNPYYVVTYSPKQHQFKFWAVADADSPANGIRDAKPEMSFVPPVDEMMNTTVWNLEEFHVKAEPSWASTQLWIRARSGPNSRVYTIKFNLLDLQSDLEHVWKNEWVCVSPGPLTIEALRINPDYPGDSSVQDPSLHNPSITECWLDFLFVPGRFTTPTLETALLVYRRGFALKRSPAKSLAAKLSNKQPLKERLCTAIASNVALERTHAGEIDYDRYEIDIGSQWQVFYGLVRDLHKRRSESLRLVYDFVEDLPWLLLKDYVCPIRELSEVEVMRTNAEVLPDQVEGNGPMCRVLEDDGSIDVAKLLSAARIFRQSLTSTFHQPLQLAVAAEILQEPSTSVTDRIKSFYDRCDLESQVTDEDVDKLYEALDELGGFNELTTSNFLAALERLDEKPRGHHERNEVTKFGVRALLRGAQDTVAFGAEILLDLLVLVVFCAFEFKPEEMSTHFDAADIYVELIPKLKEHALLTWLTTKSRHESSGRRRRRTSIGSLSQSQGQGDPAGQTMTLMESLFVGDWSGMLFPEGSQSMRLTYWIRAWTFGSQLGRQYDFITANIMGDLLKRDNTELASEFLRFLPGTPWATYLRGRLHLSLEEYAMAAVYFKRAAVGLALGHFDVRRNDSSGLLSLDEQDYFSEGIPKYYQHILSLFEKVKVHSYVAEFAEMALQALSLGREDTPDQKTELLSRLFNALIQTSHFEEAYATLTRHTNPILRKANLTTLITALTTSSHSPLLLTLPFATLSKDVDAILTSLAHKTQSILKGPPYHNLLAAFRIQRHDFRGAASILHERLERLRWGATSSASVFDPGDERLQKNLLALMNVLACVEKDNAWILAEQTEEEREARVEEARKKNKGAGGAQKKVELGPRRKVVSLEDVRKEYQEELDRVAMVGAGRFAFGAGEEMDVF
ncbi:hypothetical protein H2201_005509 [Coniosporium apollinis]|uniref:Nucleoporin Nup120/160 n=1 Tax=Coniosporium apollinis TaxID=61459 RepID=A0ABQ9NQL2_9PEZI|nr:hypothetical protein H2201_005509 [Coniosporium apollinis]